MIDTLIAIDHGISIWLHHLFRNEAMNLIMWYVSENKIIATVFLFCMVLVYKKFNLKSLVLAVISIIIAIGGIDFIVTNFFKPVFCRLRPSHDSEIQFLLEYVNNYRGGQYGFVSGHAATNMAGVMIIILMLKNNYYPYIYLLYLWVLTVSYSRIYLGVHYFGDVCGGVLVGYIWAYLVYLLFYKPLNKRYFLQ